MDNHYRNDYSSPYGGPISCGFHCLSYRCDFGHPDLAPVCGITGRRQGGLRMSRQLYNKLEKYEDEACAEEFCQDWIEDVYLLFKKYLLDCANDGRRATLSGFERCLDSLHKSIKEG